MSKRTAEASKAVALAWTNEQQRVQEGKGIRDWTLEQQKDILERGKAYDEKGRAFEGQHMKSVEKYPEYQGDPDNIQFLTKDEHLAAHQGSWQNPTNWYYNPSTKEITDFGEGKFIPCAIIELSDPYIKTLFPTQETGKETVNPENNNSNNSEVDSSSKEQKTTEQRRESPVSKKVSTEAKPKLSFLGKIKDGFEHIKELAVGFAVEHPVITAIAVAVGTEVGKEVVKRATDGGSSSSSSDHDSSRYRSDSDTTQNEDSEPEEPTEEEEELASEDSSDEATPQTKRPHDTRGYTRTRRGKVEHVRGYSTGKNRDKPDND